MNIQCLICLLLAICCSCNGTETNTSSTSLAIQKSAETLRVDMNSSNSLDSLDSISSLQLRNSQWLQEQNVPEECRFIKDKGFDIVYKINPFYMRGDFNGDNISDVAALIERRKDKKLGILICHGRSEDFYILGAGNNTFEVGGDNFYWLDIWNTQCCEGDSIRAMYGVNIFLEGEVIYVEKAEAASGLIYWKEGKYEWAQLSD